MARLLLVPVAVLTWMAGLFLLVLALAALSHTLPGGVAPAVAAPALGEAASGAALVTLLSILPGLGAALAFRRAGRAARWAAAALALLLLIAPAPSLPVATLHDTLNRPAALALAAATARGAALTMLILMAGLRAVPPGLQRAAILAGARPSQAWRHAVLTPLWPYLGAAMVASFALALAGGTLALRLAPRLATADLWTVPACLLLAGAGLAALILLCLPRREA